MFPFSGPEPAEDQTEQLVFQEPVPLLDHERDPDHDRGSLPRRQQRRVRHRQELRLHGEQRETYSIKLELETNLWRGVNPPSNSAPRPNCPVL